MKLKEKEIIEIYWVDSVSDGGWKVKSIFIQEGCNKDWLYHKSVGYFLAQDKETVTIMQSYSDKEGEYNCSERTSIPKCAIKNIKRIRQ